MKHALALACAIVILGVASHTATSQLPPTYYGLVPGPPLIPAVPENAIEPGPGPLVVIDPPPPPPPAPLPPPAPPLVTYYAVPLPPMVTLDDNPDDLAPLIVTRVILTRSCFRYNDRWHCTAPK